MVLLRRKQSKEVQYLIEKGANVEVKDEEQQTPLHIAYMDAFTDVVKYLVSNGANKNAKNKNGKHHMMLLGEMKSEDFSNKQNSLRRTNQKKETRRS